MLKTKLISNCSELTAFALSEYNKSMAGKLLCQRYLPDIPSREGPVYRDNKPRKMLGTIDWEIDRLLASATLKIDVPSVMYFTLFAWMASDQLASDFSCKFRLRHFFPNRIERTTLHFCMEAFTLMYF